jgi:guanylate kinase
MNHEQDYLDRNSLGFIFVGPSGSGKSTLRDMLLKTTLNGYHFIQYVPHTSRAKRRNESDEYHFVSNSELDRIEKSNKILFRNEYHGNRFLTTWPKALRHDELYLYIYSPSGAQKIKEYFPNHKIIQILPDRINDIKTILLQRDPNIQPSELKKRLEVIPYEIDDGGKIADDIFVNESGLQNSFVKLTEVINKYLT